MDIFKYKTKAEIREGLIVQIADFMINEGATLRETGKVFGYSKSTIHRYMTKDLFNIDSRRYDAVRKILDYNKSERHIRGGIATKKKYQKVC